MLIQEKGNFGGTAGIQVQVKVSDSMSPCQNWVPEFPFSAVETQSMEGEEQYASSQSRHRWAAQLNSFPDYTLASKLGYLGPFGTPWGVPRVHMGLMYEI